MSGAFSIGKNSIGKDVVVFLKCYVCRKSFEPDPTPAKALFHYYDTHGISPTLILTILKEHYENSSHS